MKIYGLPNYSVLRAYADRDEIEYDPEYQRQGGIWDLEKRQLFIDSLINEFDVPKIYFHEFVQVKTLADGRRVKYAIIDGRQRLETIWSYIDGDFALSKAFEYFADTSVNAAGLTYKDLGQMYPQLKLRIDAYTLPIVLVITADLEKIEEMFSRLNEAVPLNAAEKRNAYGGAMAEAIRLVANHAFFVEKIRLPNKRYQHREIAAKMLWLEQSLQTQRRVADTKKAYLDQFVSDFKRKKSGTNALRAEVVRVLDSMTAVFIDQDPLLKTQAMTVLYFLLFRRALENQWDDRLTRAALGEFEEARRQNRKLAEKDMQGAQYALLDFDNMSLQGSNDASSIRNRLEIVSAYFGNRDLDAYLSTPLFGA